MEGRGSARGHLKIELRRHVWSQGMRSSGEKGDQVG